LRTTHYHSYDLFAENAQPNLEDQGMKFGKLGLLTVMTIAIAAATGAFAINANRGERVMNETTAPTAKSVHEFAMKDIDGNDVKLSQYSGRVLMLVNTASQCGLTPQYKGLQSIYQKYQAQGFTILAFPANNFGGQEPGSNAEIKEFCTMRYKVTFPVFAKISVKGDDQHPLFRFLTSKETNPQFGGDIMWNFNKFLVSKSGEIIARFEPRVDPESPEVAAAIERALQAK
jgi:glutathione peroxidase